MKTGYYKISPEIKEFIVAQTKGNPQLGCRKISSSIQEKFKINISKSSVSAILKSEGLNKAIGRRRIHKVPPPLLSYETEPLSEKTVEQTLVLPAPEASPGSLEQTQSAQAVVSEIMPASLPNMGCWFLKAADLCLGGMQIISDTLSAVIKDEEVSEIIAKCETLLYLPLIEENPQGLSPASKMALLGLTGKEYAAHVIRGYRESLSHVKSPSQILNQLVSLAKEALAVKFILEDNTFFFLDASGHSIWSTPHIPEYFSAGLYKIKNLLNEVLLLHRRPLMLQAPPGFEAPPLAFLSFLCSFQGEDSKKAIKCIEFYAKSQELLETFCPIPDRKRLFIFGLWPWQYKKTSEAPSAGRIVLTEPKTAQRVILRSVGYTYNNQTLTLITNMENSVSDDDAIIRLYLERWPNLETGYQDFLDKIGHFSISLNINKLGKKNSVNLSAENTDINQFWTYWRSELNGYCQRHFFPQEYKEMDFLALKERFYNLPAQLKPEADCLRIIFNLPKDFLYGGGLIYACERINESDIREYQGKKVIFSAAS